MSPAEIAGVACCRGQGLWVQLTWVWHKPSWRRSPLIPTHTGLEKQTLGGHKQNLVSTRTQEKGAVTPQETDPGLPVSVQESPVVTRSSVAYCLVGATECRSVCMGYF